MTKAIEALGQDTDQLRRVANRHELHFHIDQFGYLTEHAGWKSETREATEPELQMWEILVGLTKRRLDDPIRETPVLDAIPAELEDVLWKGPYTLCAVDFVVLRGLEGFEPCNEREKLLRGLVGHYREAEYRDADIYVSRVIPKGYFYQGIIERFQPPEGERVVDPGLSATIEMTIGVELRGFGV